ncbi:MAG TPA: hypothetical protein VG755_31460 [Nannocystaceae bacterium]|nr:hypothetical protein [Nannocystaceae bacterium]
MAMLWLLLAGAPATDARGQAQAVIDAAHTEETRGCYAVTLPKRASIDAPWRAELLAEYIDWVPSSWIIEIDRTRTGASVRWTNDDGRRELVLDDAQVAALDRWAAVAVVLAGATMREDGICAHGGSFASHVPERSVSIRANGRALVHTIATQPIHETLVDGLPELASTWTSVELERLATGWLLDVEAEQIPFAEAQKQLAKLTAKPRAKGRAAIEGRLLAHRLASADDRRAVEVLRRKGYDEEALRLDLRTASIADLPDRIAPLLCDQEWRVRQAALAELDRLGDNARAPLLHATTCKLDEHAQVQTLQLLAALGPDPATSTAIDAAAATTKPLRVQVIARELRFIESGREADLEFLVRSATGGTAPLLDLTDEQGLALMALDRIASRTPKRAPEIAALAAGMLARIPMSAHATYSGMSQLVGMLGRLDAERYEQDIRRVLAHDDASAVVEAIRALAIADLEAAAREARTRVAMYAKDPKVSGGYSWNVLPYFDLLIRADAKQALPDLRRALARLEASDEVEPWKRGSARALVQYFALTKDHDRAAAALELVRSHGSPSIAVREYWIDRWSAHGIDEASLAAAVDDHDRRVASW